MVEACDLGLDLLVDHREPPRSQKLSAKGVPGKVPSASGTPRRRQRAPSGGSSARTSAEVAAKLAVRVRIGKGFGLACIESLLGGENRRDARRRGLGPSLSRAFASGNLMRCASPPALAVALLAGRVVAATELAAPVASGRLVLLSAPHRLAAFAAAAPAGQRRPTAASAVEAAVTLLLSADPSLSPRPAGRPGPGG